MTRKRRRQVKPVELVLRASGKSDVEALLATVGVGLAELIRRGNISPADAADVFFVDAFLYFSARPRLSSKLLNALGAGSELETLAEIAPGRLTAALDRLSAGLSGSVRRRTPSHEPIRTRWLLKHPELKARPRER